MVGKEIELVRQKETFVRISKTKKTRVLGEREKKPREELGRGKFIHLL